MMQYACIPVICRCQSVSRGHAHMQCAVCHAPAGQAARLRLMASQVSVPASLPCHAEPASGECVSATVSAPFLHGHLELSCLPALALTITDVTEALASLCAALTHPLHWDASCDQDIYTWAACRLLICTCEGAHIPATVFWHFAEDQAVPYCIACRPAHLRLALKLEACVQSARGI